MKSCLIEKIKEARTKKSNWSTNKTAWKLISLQVVVNQPLPSLGKVFEYIRNVSIVNGMMSVMSRFNIVFKYFEVHDKKN